MEMSNVWQQVTWKPTVKSQWLLIEIAKAMLKEESSLIRQTQFLKLTMNNMNTMNSNFQQTLLKNGQWTTKFKSLLQLEMESKTLLSQMPLIFKTSTSHAG